MVILYIILRILKIIGILILCLLLLILLLLALLLFVPLRYRAEGSIGGKTVVSGSVSWLLHIVHLSIAYEGEAPSYCFRIFGVPVRRSGQKDKRAAAKSSLRKHRQAAKRSDDDVQEAAHEAAEKRVSAQHKARTDDKNNVSDQKTAAQGKLQELLSEIKAFALSVKHKVLAFWQSLCAAKDKATFLYGRCKRMYEWWQLPDTKQAYAAVKKELRYQLQHILPRKYRIDLRFGTGDPACTGQVLGALAIAYAFLKDGLSVEPDFETDKPFVVSEFAVKGRIFLYKLLITVFRLYRDTHVSAARRTFQTMRAS